MASTRVTQSDGKVIIVTELDNSQIPKGVKEISGSLGGLKGVVKSLGAAIGAAFSVMTIVNFAKESVQAANKLSDALTGLKSILAGQGRSFSDAEKFLQEYTADGLIPMTNAITAYKNLASRGYDDSQIMSVMQALKDASAFGRQASYSMGDAVQSATEGLKNENSVLVDNAGVTKNVAKMWEEYAASIGTTANNLTQEQKILAEVNGILEETRFQAGDAAKVAGTLSGQLSQLSVNFNNLKVAVGNALKPIVESFLPVINAAIATLTRFANSVSAVIGALLGSSSAGSVQEVADSYESAASGAENLADATKEAGKAAKKYLAGFDEITKIGDSGSSTASSSTVGTGSVSTTVPVYTDAEIQDNISPKIQALVEKIQALIEPLKQIDFAPAIKSFGRLGEAVSGFGAILGDALEWAWYNILVPLAEWTVEEAGPATVNLLASALEWLNAILSPVWEGFKELWRVLTPVFDYMGGVAVGAITVLQGVFDEMTAVFENNGDRIEAIFEGIGDVIDVLVKTFGPRMEEMMTTWANTFSLMGQLLADTVDVAIALLYGLVEFVAGVLTGDWDRAWKGLANGLIGILNGVISAAQNLVNFIIDAINRLSFTVPDWIPGIGGSTVGFNLQKVSYPQIPYLAKGAVLPANKPFLAMVGDQKHGTNIEAPLETIQEAVALVMEDQLQAMMAGFEALLEENRELRRTVENIEIGDDVIGPSANRYNRKMAVVRGGV